MCKPCWYNIRRSVLDYCAIHKEGEVFFLDNGSWLEKVVVLSKFRTDQGVLLVLRLIGRIGGPERKVINLLWCPTHGSGGWVNILKDPQSRTLYALACAHYLPKWESEELEKQAMNSMAL